MERAKASKLPKPGCNMQPVKQLPNLILYAYANKNEAIPALDGSRFNMGGLPQDG